MEIISEFIKRRGAVVQHQRHRRPVKTPHIPKFATDFDDAKQ
jgi:hypothetical protein